MGPFIQGRIVLPFQLGKTESLSVLLEKRNSAAGMSGESLNYIHSFTKNQAMARKVLIFTMH